MNLQDLQVMEERILIAAEAARGNEFNAWVKVILQCETILPFTRQLGGPMDYTPESLRSK
jgi:hypothetical protein